MTPFPRFSLLVPIFALLGGFGCGDSAETAVVVEPYEGEPFPNRVAPIAYPSGPYAFVTDSLSDTVSVIDLTTVERFDERPVGRNPVDIDGPHHLAVDATRGFAYIGLSYPVVAAQGPHATHGSSVLPGYAQKLRLADLSIVGQVRVDSNPGDIVLSRDGKRLVTSHFDLLRATQNPTDLEKARATVALIDPEGIAPSGSTPATLIKTCVAPHGMAMRGDAGDTLYVACYGEDSVAIVNLAQPDAPIERIDVGPGVSGFGAPVYGPYALLLSADESTLVVSDTVSKDVRFFDTATKTFDDARTVTTLGAPFFATFSPDGARLLVAMQQPDGIVVIDPTGVDPPVTRSFSKLECVLPHIVAPNGAGYVVVCEGDKKSPGSVITLSETLAFEKSVPVGVYPDAITVQAGAP